MCEVKNKQDNFLKEIYEGYCIFENSSDRTHIFYEISFMEDELLPFSFYTVELCKIFIDNIKS